jgi:hypothetical protein
MNVDQIAAALRKHGEIPARIQRTAVPDLEDDDIDLADGFHVQVGERYMILVRSNADGTFTFFRETTTVESLLEQLRKAREASRAAPSGASAPLPGTGLGAGQAVSPPSFAESLSEAIDRWLANEIGTWQAPPDEVSSTGPAQFPGREQLLAGAAIHRSSVDGTEYVLVPPRPARPAFMVVRLDDAGRASVVAESQSLDGAADLLAGYLDGSIQAKAARFFAWLAERESSVRGDVAAPLHHAGYGVTHTGGGCLAWIRYLGDAGESYLLITTNDDIDGDPTAPVWDIGRYDGEGWINLDRSFMLADAIRAAELLPAARAPDGSSIEKVFPDVEAARAALTDFPAGTRDG